MLNILMLKSQEVEHKSAPIAFMFGAQSLTNPGKGADWLLRAISNLSSSLKRETVLLTLWGREEKKLSKQLRW